MKTKTKKEILRQIFTDYNDEHGNEPVDKRTVMAWAIRTGRYSIDQSDVISLAAYDLGEALRTEHELDPQGRKVRKNLSIRQKIRKGNAYVQTSLWQLMSEADRQFVLTSLQQSRRGIQADVISHYNTTESYNDNHNTGARIEFDYNFNLDLEEYNATDSHPEFDDEPEDDEEI